MPQRLELSNLQAAARAPSAVFRPAPQPAHARPLCPRPAALARQGDFSGSDGGWSDDEHGPAFIDPDGGDVIDLVSSDDEDWTSSSGSEGSGGSDGSGSYSGGSDMEDESDTSSGSGGPRGAPRRRGGGASSDESGSSSDGSSQG